MDDELKQAFQSDLAVPGGASGELSPQQIARLALRLEDVARFAGELRAQSRNPDGPTGDLGSISTGIKGVLALLLAKQQEEDTPQSLSPAYGQVLKPLHRCIVELDGLTNSLAGQLPHLEKAAVRFALQATPAPSETELSDGPVPPLNLSDETAAASPKLKRPARPAKVKRADPPAALPEGETSLTASERLRRAIKGV